MSIRYIHVHANCDECGLPFRVELELAYTTPHGWTVYDLAVDAIRGSLEYHDSVILGSGSSSVQGDKHLCHMCTYKADRKAERTDKD